MSITATLNFFRHPVKAIIQHFKSETPHQIDISAPILRRSILPANANSSRSQDLYRVLKEKQHKGHYPSLASVVEIFSNSTAKKPETVTKITERNRSYRTQFFLQLAINAQHRAEAYDKELHEQRERQKQFQPKIRTEGFAAPNATIRLSHY